MGRSDLPFDDLFELLLLSLEMLYITIWLTKKLVNNLLWNVCILFPSFILQFVCIFLFKWFTTVYVDVGHCGLWLLCINNNLMLWFLSRSVLRKCVVLYLVSYYFVLKFRQKLQKLCILIFSAGLDCVSRLLWLLRLFFWFMSVFQLFLLYVTEFFITFVVVFVLLNVCPNDKLQWWKVLYSNQTETFG